MLLEWTGHRQALVDRSLHPGAMKEAMEEDMFILQHHMHLSHSINMKFLLHTV